MLRNQPHLRGHIHWRNRDELVKLDEVFFTTSVVNIWNSLLADTTDSSSLRKFCASVSTSYSLRFCTVSFEWCLYGFNVFVQCVISSMFTVSIIVFATCKWLSVLCCSINLNLNLKSHKIELKHDTKLETKPRQIMYQDRDMNKECSEMSWEMTVFRESIIGGEWNERKLGNKGPSHGPIFVSNWSPVFVNPMLKLTVWFKERFMVVDKINLFIIDK